MTAKTLKKLGTLTSDSLDNFLNMVTLREKQHNIHVRRLIEFDEGELPTTIVNDKNCSQQTRGSPACSST